MAVSTASAICGVKRINFKKNILCNRDIVELVTSSLIRGAQMGEMTKPDWLRMNGP